MTVITIIENNEAFPVKAVRIFKDVEIDVYSVDQQQKYYSETMLFPLTAIATDYVNSFGKKEAREIVKRYLKFRK